jgi:phospholipase/carboxylesterase
MVNGDRDPMATPDQTRTLAARLRGRGADVDVLTFSGGHTIDVGQLPRVKSFLENADSVG